MYLREKTLEAKGPEQAATEIMYEIAASRADRIELLRINILSGIGVNDGISDKRMLQGIIRTLKSMKQGGRIQFFASPENFEGGGTEAVFLQNKYPDLFSTSPVEREGETFIYIKI